tara:strand:- start:359 stop:700 length:342 start_codon:yes stop_codon:yes gene_type:complete
MKLLNQYQYHNDSKYKVLDLIEASKKLKVFKIKVSDIFINYECPCNNTLTDFIKHVKNVNEVTFEYPIILSPDNFILDGKHRVAKAIIENKKYIKAVRFKKMPDCKEYITTNE